MSLPRPVLPNTTYLLTRRCSQRQFLLRPSPQINNLLQYCFAYAAAKFGIRLHALCVMSNHYHLTCTDPGTGLPAFMHWLNGTIARALNAYYNRRESFWGPAPYSRVTLEELEDFLSKTTYTLANPVAAGLVPDGSQWPGVRSSMRLRGPLRIRVHKPEFFFREGGPLPEVVELVLEPPPPLKVGRGVEGLGTLTQEALDEAVREEEERHRGRMEAQGRRFLGVEGVLGQNPWEAPRTRAPPGNLNPTVACRDPKLRQERLEAQQRWQEAYRQALREFSQGVRDVVFPAGTYWMRVHCGVTCAEPEPG